MRITINFLGTEPYNFLKKASVDRGKRLPSITFKYDDEKECDDKFNIICSWNKFDYVTERIKHPFSILKNQATEFVIYGNLNAALSFLGNYQCFGQQVLTTLQDEENKDIIELIEESKQITVEDINQILPTFDTLTTETIASNTNSIEDLTEKYLQKLETCTAEEQADALKKLMSEIPRRCSVEFTGSVNLPSDSSPKLRSK